MEIVRNFTRIAKGIDKNSRRILKGVWYGLGKLLDVVRKSESLDSGEGFEKIMGGF